MTKASVKFGPDAPRQRFGDYVLDMRRAELLHAGQPVALRPKALALLSILVARAGQAVPKDELLATVWPGVVVTDDSLTQCVAELRAALGDRGGQSVIRTLPRLGYRFDVPVEPLQDDAATSTADADAAGEGSTGLASPATAAPPTSAPRQAGAHLPAAATQAPEVLQTDGRSRPGLRAWRVRATALVLGLLALVSGAWLQASRTGSPPAPARIDAELAARRSVAVMPFADLSETPAPHLAEGVVEEILTDVARMRDTLVIAAGTTRALAAQGETDPARVGARLGVQFVLSGSLRRAGEQLQINVQLARAAGGTVLWSERFDYTDPSGWNWRRDVSGRIAGTLDVKMHDAALDLAGHAGRSSQAMEEWMRGEYLLRRYKTRSDVQRARAHFEAALALEPRSVNALIGLAGTHHAEVLRRWRIGREKDESLARARELARAALGVDPNHPGAVATLGAILSFANEFDEAERVLTRALVLNPNSAEAHRDLGGLKYFMGRFDEVQPHIATALRLNPLDAVHVWQCHMILGDSLMHLGQAAARVHHQLAVLAEPALPNPHFSMASQAALADRIDEAREHLAVARRLSPPDGWSIARSIAADRSAHPAYLEARGRYRQGLRLAGLPERQEEAGAPLVANEAR
ncbi:MAG: winged helix-turn-helix domain-containing protein [Rubrivivax sp.]|nr:winged helix-turn-helix domain-containing protein [Rubrivivax sp.]